MSSEPQWFVALHHGNWNSNVAAIVYIQSFDLLYRLKCSRLLSCSIEEELSFIVQEAVAGISLPYLPIKGSNSWIIDICYQVQLKFLANSDSNRSRLSVQVWVRVQTEQLRNWQSGFTINPNRQLKYSLMVNSRLIWIGLVVSGSIHRYI